MCEEEEEEKKDPKRLFKFINSIAKDGIINIKIKERRHQRDTGTNKETT